MSYKKEVNFLNNNQVEMISEIVLDKNNIPYDVNETKLKVVLEILIKSENPEKLLKRLSLLSNEAQIEAVYSLSKSNDLIKGFLQSKSRQQKEDEMLKKPLVNEKKIRKLSGVK